MTTSTAPTTKAIVTGHTRGLGAALADALLARGVAVLGVARTRHASLAERYAGTFEEAEVDLGDAARVGQWLAGDGLRAFLHGAERALLINNAGTVQPIGPCGAQEADAIAQAVALNVTAPLLLANAFVATSADAADRRIAHISSGAARNAYAGWSVYCATKAALDHHARSVALDAAPALKIVSVAPGVIDTDMQAEIRGTEPERFPLRARFDELKRSGQLATPDEAARKLVDFLLSDGFGQVPVADVRDLPAN